MKFAMAQANRRAASRHSRRGVRDRSRVAIGHSGTVDETWSKQAYAWTQQPQGSQSADADLQVQRTRRQDPRHRPAYRREISAIGARRAVVRRYRGGGELSPARRALLPDHRLRPGGAGADPDGLWPPGEEMDEGDEDDDFVALPDRFASPFERTRPKPCRDRTRSRRRPAARFGGPQPYGERQPQRPEGSWSRPRQEGPSARTGPSTRPTGRSAGRTARPPERRSAPTNDRAGPA